HGKIERHVLDGEVVGTLRESAVELVQNIMPKPSAQERIRGLERAQSLANKYGITSLQEAHADEDVLKTYADLEKQGRLTVRVVTSLGTDANKSETQVAHLAELRAKYSAGKVRASTAKIFADGVIESQTAALIEPYLDKPGDRGMLNFSPDVLKRLIQALDKNGFQVHVHAIGDRAVKETLNAFESTLKANGSHDLRHHMAHLELVHPKDIPRFSELGVTANFQSFWAYEDPYIKELTQPRLGA